jgi:hypothetical protein
MNAIVFENLCLDLLEIAIERTSVFTVSLNFTGIPILLGDTSFD